MPRAAAASARSSSARHKVSTAVMRIGLKHDELFLFEIVRIAGSGSVTSQGALITHAGARWMNGFWFCDRVAEIREGSCGIRRQYPCCAL